MTTLTDSGQGFDVAIGGLGFRLAVTDEQPYERATAQFRKEQFDSAPTVGDQSLTGWWTRGQLSFHKGAGVNYYEVLEGEAVLDRFNDCNGVDVFEPGTAALLPSLTSMSLSALDVVPAALSAGGGVYALTDAGLYYSAGASSTLIATSNAAVPTAVTSSGSRYYVANGTKIEKQYDASEARTNHITNPSFETNTTGWSAGGVGDSIARSSTYAKYGTYSLRVTPNPTFGGSAGATITGLSIGTTYRVAAWVRVESGAGTTNPVVLTFGGSTMGTTSTLNAWERLTGTFLATATSHTLLASTSGPNNHRAFNIDAVLVTESPYTGDYFDGTQAGCAWAGTPHASKSTYATSSNNASTALITLTGSTWEGVWWAKGRIFAVDDDGYWYALPAAVDTVSNADAFWSSGVAGANWSLTQGTGPIYITDGFDIYAVTVDTDGVVPTLTTPTTVARMPLGEEISTISYYLGYLIVCTTRGVRVALTQDDQVLLGPLVIEGDFSDSVRVGVYDTKAYVVGRPEDRGGDYVLCAIDLGTLVSDLTPAWSPLATVSELASDASGATVDASGRVYTWASETLYAMSPDELHDEGYLLTGYHRFGTLEPKFFSELLVRIGGSGGEVEVFRVDADSTETALGTLTASGTLSLGMTAVAERVALKFVLTRDSADPTKGPELLGYQLRALPAPQRQRMVRVPVLCYDYETGANGKKTGRDGSAYERLAELEAMEESGAVHDYQDFRTGETGSVFIESIEFRNTTSPATRTNGFGGTAWLTLRKV